MAGSPVGTPTSTRCQLDAYAGLHFRFRAIAFMLARVRSARLLARYFSATSRDAGFLRPPPHDVTAVILRVDALAGRHFGATCGHAGRHRSIMPSGQGRASSPLEGQPRAYLLAQVYDYRPTISFTPPKPSARSMRRFIPLVLFFSPRAAHHYAHAGAPLIPLGRRQIRLQLA